MFQANIPLKFWGYCVQPATYLINRLPSAMLGYMTPYERMYNRKPSLDYLKVLGCLCYAKSVNESNKLMPISRKAVHMGYSETKKGYILYDLTNKISW